MVETGHTPTGGTGLGSITTNHREETVIVITKLLAPAFLSAAAAAVVLSPSATATLSNCEESARSSVCQRPGHSSIYASPGEVVQQRQMTGLPGGMGPSAPVLSIG